MKKLFLVASLAISVLMTGCSPYEKINDTQVGIRQTFSGAIQDKVLGQGIYQTIVGDVIQVSRRNIIINVQAQPIVKEKVPLSDFEMKVNYGIVPENAAIAYKTEKNQNIITSDGDVYLLGQYVQYVANSSIQDVLSKYAALEVNDNRSKIEQEITDSINQKLHEQKKDQFVKVNEINIMKVVPPAAILQSSLAIVRSENDLKTKQNELLVAKVEQEKMKVLASQADSQYVNMLNAQANVTTADALKIAAEKGTLNTIIVPKDFNSLGKVN